MVNEELLAGVPLTVTVNDPEDPPDGTITAMEVPAQLTTVAVVPSSAIALLACVAPKLEPAIVTNVPIGPDVGERPVIDGA